jgi:hypothetical protein
MSAIPGNTRRTEQEALVRALQAAFPFQPLPEMTLGGEPILAAKIAAAIPEDDWTDASALPATDDWLDSGESSLTASWPDLAEQHLLDGNDAPVFLDGPAFVYYLPAFLVFALRHLDDAATLKRGKLMLAQALSTVTDTSARHIANYAQLDRPQRAVIVAVLRHVATHSVIHGPEAQRALTRYWAQSH